MTRGQFLRLRGIGSDSDRKYRVLLQTIYNETDRYMDSLARLVHEGKAVEEAANFGRWLRFSGVLELLDRFTAPGLEFPSFERRIVALLDECGERFRGGKVDAKYTASDIAEINRKLDLLISDHGKPAVVVSVQQSEDSNATNGAPSKAAMIPRLSVVK